MTALPTKFRMLDCDGCPHHAAGRAAERVTALTGDRHEEFCLVGLVPKALVAPVFKDRHCPCDHRAVGTARRVLAKRELQLGLVPLLGAEAWR